MSDGTVKTLDAANYTVGDVDMSAVGTKTVTVALKANDQLTTSFVVTVSAKTEPGKPGSGDGSGDGAGGDNGNGWYGGGLRSAVLWCRRARPWWCRGCARRCRHLSHYLAQASRLSGSKCSLSVGFWRTEREHLVSP